MRFQLLAFSVALTLVQPALAKDGDNVYSKGETILMMTDNPDTPALQKVHTQNGVIGKITQVFQQGEIQVKWENGTTTMLPSGTTGLYKEIKNDSVVKENQPVLYQTQDAGGGLKSASGKASRVFDHGYVDVAWNTKGAANAVLSEDQLKPSIDSEKPFNKGNTITHYNGQNYVIGKIAEMYQGNIAEVKWDAKGAANAFIPKASLDPVVKKVSIDAVPQPSTDLAPSVSGGQMAQGKNPGVSPGTPDTVIPVTAQRSQLTSSGKTEALNPPQ